MADEDHGRLHRHEQRANIRAVVFHAPQGIGDGHGLIAVVLEDGDDSVPA
jgi:hypothetical protein